MNRYYPFESCTLIEQEIPQQTPAKKPTGMHHIFIYDRSGSMYHVLDRLITDMKARFRMVCDPGDTVTVGWFSGHGEFRFPLVGHRITTGASAAFTDLDTILDATNSTIGLTCFSEILTDAKKVVSDLVPLGNTFSLTFLTDGHPTVSPLKQEIERIRGAIDEIKGHIAASLIVGYGPYYNKTFLSEMAAQLGGTAIHSEDLKAFGGLYNDFVDRSRGNEPRVKVAMDHTSSGPIFSIDGSEIRVYERVISDSTLPYVAVSPAAGSVYYFTSSNVSNAKKITDQQRDLRIFYAAALAQVRNGRADLALEILGTIGDKALIDVVTNAFTYSEFGAAETLISNAIGRPQARFMGGRKAGYVPPRDAFCLVQAMELLEADPGAAFLPTHAAFDYRRIGAKRNQAPGYPKFQPHIDVKAELTNLIWNEAKLNLSLQCKIPGMIELPETAPSGLRRPEGMDKTFSTFIWRNYSVVKDGALNVFKLPILLSKELFPKLREHGMIESGTRYYLNKPYVLDLTAVPVMNRAMADGLCSGEAMAQAQIKMVQVRGELKALKWYRDQLEPRSERPLDMRGVAGPEEAFLRACGVTPNGYSPPMEGTCVQDFYLARTLTLKVKGETLPPVAAVQAQPGKGKSFGAMAVASGLSLGAAAYAAKDIAALKGMIERKDRDLRRLRGEMQRARFAILLGGRWFNEFGSRDPEDCKLTVDGHEVSFILGEERVDL